MAERGAFADDEQISRIIMVNGSRQSYDRASGKLSVLTFDRYTLDLNLLRDAPGVLVIDNPMEDGWITPVEAAGEFAVYVSRIRNDPTVEFGLNLWVVSDNLRKGAALNAVQIAQLLDEQGIITPQGGYRSITV